MSKVYQIISDRVMGLLEEGTPPWRRPWGGEFRFPRNMISGKDYRGINVFLLSAMGYESPFWLTFKQAQSLGGSVRKGEKSVPVVFWKEWETEDRKIGESVKVPVLRYFSAFNLCQCEGIPDDKIPDEQRTVHENDPIDRCETVVSEMQRRPEISHGFRRAAYRPQLDTVYMPSIESFDGSPEYYGTLFHELGHATGHESRLNRKGITELAAFGSQDYGKEELVAEMTAAFLCGHCGIDTVTLENQAAYVSGWLRTIKQDAKLVVTAAAQAQKAADFILGRTWN